MMQSHQTEQGFTLLEVLFALTIIAVVMSSYRYSLATASKHSLAINERFMATVLLRNMHAQESLGELQLEAENEIKFAGKLWLLKKEKVLLPNSGLRLVRYQAAPKAVVNQAFVSLLRAEVANPR